MGHQEPLHCSCSESRNCPPSPLPRVAASPRQHRLLPALGPSVHLCLNRELNRGGRHSQRPAWCCPSSSRGPRPESTRRAEVHSSPQSTRLCRAAQPHSRSSVHHLDATGTAVHTGGPRGRNPEDPRRRGVPLLWPETVEKKPASNGGKLSPSAAAPLPGPSTDHPPGVSFSGLRSRPLSLKSTLSLWWRIFPHSFTHIHPCQMSSWLCLCGSSTNY